MSNRDRNDEFDLEYLIEAMVQPVEPDRAFRRALSEEMRRRLAVRRGEAGTPEGWALCPFDTFCVAEQSLPRALRTNCPWLHAAPVLRVLKSRGSSVRVRPCAGLAQRRETIALIE